MSLTAREEKFCQEYVKRLNKTQAAIAAGYSKKSAKEIAYETFTKPHIQNRILEIQAEIREKMGIAEHSVITELASLGFWTIKDFLNKDGSIKNLATMQKQKLKPVAGIKVTERIVTVEDGKVEKIVTTELKLTDKRAALGDLGRHLGIFELDNKQKKTDVPQPLSDSQFDKLLNMARETKTGSRK